MKYREENSYTSFMALGDGMMYPNLTLDKFKHSLLLNLLFHDRVALDGAAFFNSLIIKEYMQDNQEKNGGKTSILEHFTAQGLVAPAIRDRRVKTAEGLFNSLVSTYQNPRIFLHEKDKELLGLYRALEIGLKVEAPFYRLERKKLALDHGYSNLMFGLLQKESDEIFDTLRIKFDHIFFGKLWRANKTWRMDALNKARFQTLAKKRGVALRRTELIDELCKAILGKEKHSGNVLKDIQEMKNKLSDPIQRVSLEFIITCMNQYHHLDLSEKYAMCMDFPVYKLASPIILADYNHKIASNNQPFRKFKCSTLRLAPFRKLLKLDPSQLFDLREELYPEYRKALLIYADSYDYQDALGVERSLERYFNRLNKAANSKGLPIGATVKSNKEIVKDLFTTLTWSIPGGLAFAAGTGNLGLMNVFSAISVGGARTMFQFGRKHYLESGKPFLFEATVPNRKYIK